MSIKTFYRHKARNKPLDCHHYILIPKQLVDWSKKLSG